MRFSSVESTMSFLRRRRSRFLLFSCIMWFKPDLLRRILPDPVTRNRLAAARLVFIFGMADGAPMGRRSRRPPPDRRGAVDAAEDAWGRALWRKPCALSRCVARTVPVTLLRFGWERGGERYGKRAHDHAPVKKHVDRAPCGRAV